MKKHLTTRTYKDSYCHNFITYFSPLTLGLTLILNASNCKNKPIQNSNNILHDLDLLSKKQHKKKKNKHKKPILDHKNTQNCKTDSISSQNEQIKFHLSDIELPTGTTKSMTLAVLSDPKIVVGYTIKSVYVIKNTNNTPTNYSKTFGIDELTNKSIPPSGLTFTIKNLDRDPGTYTLKIKVGKQGKGSKITEQIISCIITCSTYKQANNKPFIEQIKDYSNYGGNIGKIIAGNKGESVGKLLGSIAATVKCTYQAVGNTLSAKNPDQKEQDDNPPIDNTQHITSKIPQNTPKITPPVKEPKIQWESKEFTEIPWHPSLGIMT